MSRIKHNYKSALFIFMWNYFGLQKAVLSQMLLLAL